MSARFVYTPALELRSFRARKKVQHGSSLHLKLFSQTLQPLVDLMTDLVFDRFEPLHQLSLIFGGQEFAGQRE